MKYKLLFGLLFGLTTGLTMAQTKSTLHVKVNLPNNKGNVRYCLFRGEAGFPQEEEKAVGCAFELITGTGVSEHTFTGLPAGRYAVAVYHDENNNQKLDLNLMGIPREKTGFSNGAKLGMTGPPSFEKAAFEINSPSVVQTIIVK